MKGLTEFSMFFRFRHSAYDQLALRHHNFTTVKSTSFQVQPAFDALNRHVSKSFITDTHRQNLPTHISNEIEICFTKRLLLEWLKNCISAWCDDHEEVFRSSYFPAFVEFNASQRTLSLWQETVTTTVTQACRLAKAQ
jgi:hypothetical protein